MVILFKALMVGDKVQDDCTGGTVKGGDEEGCFDISRVGREDVALSSGRRLR